jgi:hypothetical protein
VINYDGRRFRVVTDAEDAASVVYRQDGDLLFAEFGGGEVRRGSLTGVCATDGTLDFGYTMVLGNGEVVSGRCVSTPTVLDDGRIRLHEVWERYGANASSGVSELEEVPA